VLVAQGRLTYLMGVAACFLGLFVGDVFAFLIGRVCGRQALNSKWLSRWIAPQRILSATQLLQERGAAAVFISRFIPGLRVATYFTAGLLRLNCWKFALSLAAATAVWVPLVVSATRLLGENALRHALSTLSNGILVIAVSFVLLLTLRRVFPKFSSPGM
jgi:membrane protein DedA with SNARE-associated domain